MAKNNQFDEYDFLGVFYKEMLVNGYARNLIHLTINAKLVESIYESTQHSLSEEQLCKLADICLANGWIEQRSIGSKYGYLELTTSGFGVIKSKLMQQERLKNRSVLKKLSDYIDEHKGLFVFLGFLVALIGLCLKYYGGN